MYDLALDEQNDPDVRHEAIRVLKVVHKDWVEAQKAVAGVARDAKPSAAPFSGAD